MLALARRAADPHLRLVLRSQVVRLLARLAFLGLGAALIGGAVVEGTFDFRLLAALLASFAVSTLAGYRAEAAALRGEAEVADAVGAAAEAVLQAMPARTAQAIGAGSLIVSLQRHPEAIASLVVGHQAARRMMGLGPLLAAAALAIVSWQASVLVLLLTPVMIVFFALVGGLIRQRAQAQEAEFGHLAGQFADRIRALPTILAHHALPQESAKLDARLDSLASRTMDVLRIAFLNAAIIDFFASLSIAMLAVFLGLGHLKLMALPGFAGLALWQSLFILMIAPDYFAPFRRFSEQYHAKAEGEAAAAALDRLLAPTCAAPPVPLALSAIRATLPAVGLVVLTGPSGSGKTTLLRGLAGIDGEAAPLGHHTRWIGMDCLVPEGTLGEAIAWPAPRIDATRLDDVLARVGLAGDPTMPLHVGAGGVNLSGGQRLRLSIARALLADGPVLADEPTAKLDPMTAALVRTALTHMARRRLVLVATHDRALIEAAAQRIALGDRLVQEEAA